MKKSIVCIALMLGLSISISACATKTPPPANQAPGAAPAPAPGGGGAATVDASAIYKQNCVSCHGNNMEGSVGPNLTKVGSKYSKEQIATILANGKGAMPSFKGRLSDTDMSAISDWLAAKK